MADMFQGASKPLLTEQQVEQWVRQREGLLQELKRTQNQLVELDRKLSAVELLTGKKVLQAEGGAAGEAETMPDIMVKILAEESRLQSPRELIDTLRQYSPEFRERLNANRNYFYTMSARLVKRGRIIKEGKRYRVMSLEEI